MEPFIGQIQAFGFNFAPRGWALCDGQLLPINQYVALYSLIGTQYGGDGRSSFALPDLRGRVPMHVGTGNGLTNRRLGRNGGTETNTLTINQMPNHNHILLGAEEGNTDDPKNNFIAGDGTNSFSTTSGSATDPNGVGINGTNSTGGSQAQNNMQPFLVINYCIALDGVFPSRG
jgi:microcystin-dependent protein